MTETLEVVFRALLTVSVTLTDCEPAVLNVTWKACWPWSALVKV